MYLVLIEISFKNPFSGKLINTLQTHYIEHYKKQIKSECILYFCLFVLFVVFVVVVVVVVFFFLTRVYQVGEQVSKGLINSEVFPDDLSHINNHK